MSGSIRPLQGIPTISRSYESYVNPNARCPECGKAVFFYQSPDGGRVFFEELGPPWPKHPCTDNTSIPNRIEASPISSTSKTYKWQEQGWEPFFINVITSVDNEFVKLTGTFRDENVRLYIRKTVSNLSTVTISLLRKVAENRYDLSYVNAQSNTKTTSAFSVLWEARDYLGKVKPVTKSNRSKRKKITPAQKAKPPKKLPSSDNSGSSKNAKAKRTICRKPNKQKHNTKDTPNQRRDENSTATAMSIGVLPRFCGHFKEAR